MLQEIKLSARRDTREREKERGKLNKKVSQTPTHALTEMRWQYRQTERDIDRARETHAK